MGSGSVVDIGAAVRVPDVEIDRSAGGRRRPETATQRGIPITIFFHVPQGIRRYTLRVEERAVHRIRVFCCAPAQSRPASKRTQRATLDGGIDLRRTCSLLCNDVHYARNGIRSVERALGPVQHLDPFYLVDGQMRRSEAASGRHGIVYFDTVNQKQGVGRFGTAKENRRVLARSPVLRYAQSSHVTQHFSDRRLTAASHVFRGDYGDRTRDLPQGRFDLVACYNYGVQNVPGRLVRRILCFLRILGESWHGGKQDQTEHGFNSVS